MYQEENEVSINLADMFAYILHHWKLILILSIAFMVLVGGFMSYKGYKEVQNKYEESTYSAMMKNMTDAQIETVEQFYNRYTAYKERIADNQYYVDNSLRMKLDANNISVLTREYLIKTGYSDIMSSFSTAALDIDDYSEMAKVIGNDIDPRFVYELISLNGNTQQEAYDIDTDKVGDVVNGSIEYSYTGILTLRVTANSKEVCDKLAVIADKAITEHLEKLKAAGIKAEMSELTDSYTEKVDADLADYQRSKIEEGSTLITDYHDFEDSARSSMDEDEQALFKYMLDKTQNVKQSFSWKKWVIIGFGAGLVLALVILVIRYLLIPGIKTPEDALLYTKEKEIGIVIQTPKSRVFLGKLFHNWAKNVEFHGALQIKDDDMIPLVCDRIVKICESKEAKSVFLIVDVDGGYTEEVVKKCVKILSESGISAKAGNPIASVEALKELRESAAAVLALTNKCSLPDSVRGNKAVCEENKIPIVGNFIIHPQS